MSNASTSWARLPPNIRHEVFRVLPGLGGVCSLLATVSREWQSVIEPLNFAEISLTIPRLSNPDSAAILFQKRSHIRYIWFRVELKQYGCGLCTLEDGDSRSISAPTQIPMSASVDRAGIVAPKWHAIERKFDEIMGEGPFEDEELEMWWWQTLPLVPGVAVVLLRQQTRRRWKPVALANMLTGFPNMKELCYKPWSEWDSMERHTDQRNQTLIELLAETRLSKLTLFENFNQSYPGKCCGDERDATRRGSRSDGDAEPRDAGTVERKRGLGNAVPLPGGARDRQSAIITLRGTSELALGSAVTQAWDAIALRHGHDRVVVRSSSVDPGTIRCHGDAICQLGLSTEVIRPISLRQMLNEHELRAGPAKWTRS
ncbi:hypothetical protein S40285_06915 [Stachybotrys chlorohalonatus IBT 40285]|uniref:DUF6546 domain-containing protein n=1 Tax=Stachybotrys chlorohalonatus (strain IBT 40285) TaxID=1283841 RepID=A0A084QH31_STAC4|nr:hypothetical protein S40285_06915 [Stachybotrys chlorohalonata IBT 40285]